MVSVTAKHFAKPASGPTKNCIALAIRDALGKKHNVEVVTGVCWVDGDSWGVLPESAIRAEWEHKGGRPVEEFSFELTRPVGLK